MKKLYQKLLLWQYRRLLRKYFMLYVRKGCTVDNAIILATAIVAWRKGIGNIKSQSSLCEFLKIADECQAPSPPPI